MGQLYDMLYPTKFSRPKVSLEYEAVDWPKFIPIFTTVFRYLTKEHETKINNPGALIYLFLGSWSMLAECLQSLLKLYIVIKVPGSVIIKNLVRLGIFNDLHLDASAELKRRGYGKIDLSNLEDKCNIYQMMFVNYKLVEDKDLEELRRMFVGFQILVMLIKTHICTKCEPRLLTVEEISQMKLFKPTRLQKEINTAMDYYKKKSPELYKLAQEVLVFIQKEIVDYIIKNVEKD